MKVACALVRGTDGFRHWGGVRVALAVLLAASSASAQTMVFGPAADAELIDDPADGVFEAIDATDLAIDLEGIGVPTARTRRGVLEFDLSVIPQGASITQATLRLPTFGGSSNSRLTVFGYVGDGVVELADAERGDTIAGRLRWSSRPPVVQVDVADYVEALISRGETWLGLNLRTDEDGTNDTLRFSASEYAVDPPELEITWDASGPPEPPHFWYWLLALEDGYATDDPTDGVFDSILANGATLIAQSTVTFFLNDFVTRRAMLEFDLTPLGSDVVILDAFLELDPSQLKTSGGSATFELYGYTGDGVVELGDADAGSTLVDSVEMTTTTNAIFDVASFIEPLTAGTPGIAGFNLRSDLDGVTSGNGHDEMITVGAARSTNLTRLPPKLIVEVSAPQAVPALGPVAVGAALLAWLGAAALRFSGSRSRGSIRRARRSRTLPTGRVQNTGC